MSRPRGHKTHVPFDAFLSLPSVGERDNAWRNAGYRRGKWVRPHVRRDGAVRLAFVWRATFDGWDFKQTFSVTMSYSVFSRLVLAHG